MSMIILYKEWLPENGSIYKQDISTVSSCTCLTLWDRKELATRLLPGGTEFKEAVAKEVVVIEQRFAQKQTDLEQKISDARRQYAALEDEFRMALIIEAKRFSEVNPNSEVSFLVWKKIKNNYFFYYL